MQSNLAIFEQYKIRRVYDETTTKNGTLPNVPVLLIMGIHPLGAK